jgi:hypothetical protein
MQVSDTFWILWRVVSPDEFGHMIDKLSLEPSWMDIAIAKIVVMARITLPT